MLAILDALAIAKAVFVGTSMGGGMAMVAAAMAPQRMAGAVLNDVGPEIDPVGLERIRGYAGVPKTAATWREAARALPRHQRRRVSRRDGRGLLGDVRAPHLP